MFMQEVRFNKDDCFIVGDASFVVKVIGVDENYVYFSAYSLQGYHPDYARVLKDFSIQDGKLVNFEIYHPTDIETFNKVEDLVLRHKKEFNRLRKEFLKQIKNGKRTSSGT